MRRREEPDDPIQIDEESGHDWWAGREELDRSIDRRWRGSPPSGAPRRRAADAASADAPRPPRDPWDPSSLFTSGSAGASATDVDEGSWEAGRPTTDRSNQGGAGVPPWSTLGLTSEASWDDVVQRHRELAKEHHPDRHGVDDSDERRRAEDRMASINAAFDDLGRIYRLTDDR
ncbi:MAG: J domain-containing protein [Acidimicrobiia bacterium]|nr:J domain-containing protein [Acidimicrobiia bacterium]